MEDAVTFYTKMFIQENAKFEAISEPYVIGMKSKDGNCTKLNEVLEDYLRFLKEKGIQISL